MSAEQTPDIAAVLAEHPGWTQEVDERRSDMETGSVVFWRFRCSGRGCLALLQAGMSADNAHRAHVAAALAPVLAAAEREAEQRALREAANERVNPNDSTTAYRFYSEQRRWLRDRADRITEPVSHEAAASGEEASKA